MTARSASFRSVSGSAFTTGIIASGKRAYEKNVPDRIHIGSITRFISPDTASMVRARLATSMPSPANDRAPSTVMNATAANEPRTPTWNTPQPAPHEVHAEQAGDQEVDVARTRLGDPLVRDARGISAAAGALQHLVGFEAGQATLRAGRVVPVH